MKTIGPKLLVIVVVLGAVLVVSIAAVASDTALGLSKGTDGCSYAS
jgi:hypothetical protein